MFSEFSATLKIGMEAEEIASVQWNPLVSDTIGTTAACPESWGQCNLITAQTAYFAPWKYKMLSRWYVRKQVF